MRHVTPQNFDRLARAMMERHRVNYARAQEMLANLRLRLVCGEEIRVSAALQAALLTAINTGKRAFRGGLTVHMPADVGLLVSWPGKATLNEAVHALGSRTAEGDDEPEVASLFFGNVHDSADGLRVFCDGWRGGLMPAHQECAFQGGADFALGGVFAGGLGVARVFLSAAQISHRDVNGPVGFSIWRPDLCWLDTAAAGPELENLPAKLWILGLGHLGQGYAWSLGLLPKANAPMMIYLQDYDIVEEGNWSAGLFCEEDKVGRLKTRLSAEWLECRGFLTRLVERPFDLNIMRGVDEPRIALSGFDNPESRRILEEVGFDLIVDAGLGASLDHFDRIVVRTFPNASQRAAEVWAQPASQGAAFDPALFGEPEGECGIVFQEIAGKAISSSFTGACASAFVVGEVLRAIHGGKRCEFFSLQLRDVELPRSPYLDEVYQHRVVRNGVIPVNARQGATSYRPAD